MINTGHPLQQSLHENYASRGDIRRTRSLIELATAVPTIIVTGRNYGPLPAVRYLIGLAAALAAQHTFLNAMIRKIGPERSSLADTLTLSRATAGSVLAGLVTSGVRDRKGIAGWIAWLMPLLGATLTDWVDGPLARQAGSTRLGSVLDIEADSWLTLWSAAGSVAWGDLPRLCLLPPILRYLDPILDLLRGKLPRGGGPWWSRVTGTAQMVLFIAALAPQEWPLRKRVLTSIALPVSGGQAVAIIILLARKLLKR